MTEALSRISTGITGFDHLHHGGPTPRRGYVVTGRPGTGKTIPGLNILTAGVVTGEACVYSNLEESVDDIEVNVETVEVDLDDIDGHRLSVQGAVDTLERELNSLGRYLKNMGVAVIFVDTVDALTGEFTPTNGGVNPFRDNVVLPRHLAKSGELHKSIGILKKRTSDFERFLREFENTPMGITVGDPLHTLRGIFSGTPGLVKTETDTGLDGGAD